MADERSMDLVGDYLSGKISRGQLLKAALAAGIATAAAPGLAAAATTGTGTPSGTGAATGRPYTTFPFYPQVTSGTYTPESVEDIVSNMLTQEYLHLNAGAVVLGSPTIASSMGITGVALANFQAFTAIHQYQIDFWSALVPGATPVTTTFTIDPKLVGDAPSFLAAGELLDTLRVATAIAATREFAELGQPTLAKYAAQTAGVDAEMRQFIRYLGALAGNAPDQPPLNKAFETDLVLYTRDAIAILRGVGLIGGSGIPASYPGRDAVLAATGSVGKGIIQQVPNNASSTVAVTGPGSILGPRT